MKRFLVIAAFVSVVSAGFLGEGSNSGGGGGSGGGVEGHHVHKGSVIVVGNEEFGHNTAGGHSVAVAHGATGGHSISGEHGIAGGHSISGEHIIVGEHGIVGDRGIAGGHSIAEGHVIAGGQVIAGGHVVAGGHVIVGEEHISAGRHEGAQKGGVEKGRVEFGSGLINEGANEESAALSAVGLSRLAGGGVTHPVAGRLGRYIISGPTQIIKSIHKIRTTNLGGHILAKSGTDTGESREHGTSVIIIKGGGQVETNHDNSANGASSLNRWQPLGGARREW